MNLLVFNIFITWGFGGMIFYSLLEFRSIWHQYLIFPIWLLFVFGANQAINTLIKIPFIKGILGIGIGKNKIQSFFVKIGKFFLTSKIGKFILISFFFILAAYFAEALNIILDILKTVRIK